jgi:hypothetical protein
MSCMFGFIITRHVNSVQSNLLWIECIQQIRRFYPSTPIAIIDDASDMRFVSKHVNMRNCFLVQSEFPKRGELLPYYYLFKHKWFSKAVILHDSVFLKRRLQSFETCSVSRLWDFPALHEDRGVETTLLQTLKNNATLLKLHADDRFRGVFGCMAVVTLEFVTMLHAKYDFFVLLNHVSSRKHRMCLERVLGVVFTAENVHSSLLGNILTYCKWGVGFQAYKHNLIRTGPLVKVWSGR